MLSYLGAERWRKTIELRETGIPSGLRFDVVVRSEVAGAPTEPEGVERAVEDVDCIRAPKRWLQVVVRRDGGSQQDHDVHVHVRIRAPERAEDHAAPRAMTHKV